MKVFKERKVKLVKYNYSLDKETQYKLCYDSYMQVSQDEKRLIITVKKPVKDEYVLQADPGLNQQIDEAEKKDDSFDSKVDFN